MILIPQSVNYPNHPFIPYSIRSSISEDYWTSSVSQMLLCVGGTLIHSTSSGEATDSWSGQMFVHLFIAQCSEMVILKALESSCCLQVREQTGGGLVSMEGDLLGNNCRNQEWEGGGLDQIYTTVDKAWCCKVTLKALSCRVFLSNPVAILALLG